METEVSNHLESHLFTLHCRHIPTMATDNVSMECTVNVRTIESGSFSVSVPSDQRGVVGVIKAKLEELTGVSASRQRLLHRGRELLGSDDDTAQSLGWGETVVLHMVTQSAPGSQQRSQGQGAPPPAAGMPPGDMPQVLTDMLNSFANSTGGRVAVGQISDAGDFGRMMSQIMSGEGQIADPIGGRLLSGRIPPLNQDGSLRLGSSYDVLHRMLRRLEDNNLDEDDVPGLQETSLEMFRDEQHSRPFAAAVIAFLSACREILRGCTLNRETREVVNRVLRAAGQGTLPLGVEVESFPVEDIGNERDANDYSWLQNVSHEDLTIVSAVSIGELARRYLAILDQNDAPTGINATIGRVAERLRSISSVSNHEETVAQIRLVAGHLSRIAVAGAELGRSMAYLTSALEHNNMFFVQLYPGYIEMQNGLPRPHLGILHNMEAHRVVRMVPDVMPGMPTTGTIAGIMSVEVPLPAGTATNNEGRDTQADATRDENRNDAPNTQGAPNVAPSGVEGILRSIPQVEQILSSLGGPEASGNLGGIFSNALRNVASSNVNMDQIINDVKEAITQGLSAAAAQIRSVSTVDTPSLDQMISTAVPEITSRVGNVLRTRVASIINAAGENHGAPQQAPVPSTEPSAPPPSEQMPASTAQTASPEPGNQKPADEDKGFATEKTRPEKDDASGSKKESRPVMGLGSAGLKKRKSVEKPGPSNAPKLPLRPSRSSSRTSAPSASAMQNIMGQVMGSNAGGPSAGGGVDFGSLLNSAGPLLGQMMGGGSGRSRNQAPLDIEEVLERDISSAEERERWREHLLQSRSKHSSGGEESLSETYLASIPSNSGGNGFLDGLL